ncbi:MAG: thrombospondin type 3 repeat-containing protein [Bacteroidales bacterium]|nr:thrombospondin type 3 repeat-containing protein [Bacteroidales bacterium]
MFDWKISAGSTCSRTPVFAVIDPSGNCEQDTDGDGTPDSEDECPNDPLKILAGLCGCNVTESSCGKQTLDLEKGWNLVALSVLPNNAAISGIFSTVISKIEVIKDENIFYKYGQSDFMNGLKTLAPHKAYLIKASVACTLTISGTPIKTVQKEFKKGWNMFGYSLSENIEISDFFSTIWNNSFEMIKNFEGFNDKTGGTLNVLSPGEGYFIKVSSDTTINR